VLYCVVLENVTLNFYTESKMSARLILRTISDIRGTLFSGFVAVNIVDLDVVCASWQCPCNVVSPKCVCLLDISHREVQKNNSEIWSSFA
jgi:hypothetical protein